MCITGKPFITELGLDTGYRKCVECLKVKSIDNFGRSASNSTGINGKCKECVKEYNREYREKNKEELKRASREYYRDNKDRLLEYRAEYLEKNRERINEQKREHYQENKGRLRKVAIDYHYENRDNILKKQKKYYEENKNEILDNNRKWAKANPEVVRKIGQEYEARKNSVEHSLTLDQWEEILKHYNSSCAYCGMAEATHLNRYGERLHQDHVVPLKSGGPYSYDNIVPACKSCNSSKSDRELIKWYENYEHYDKDRLDRIKQQIN